MSVDKNLFLYDLAVVSILKNEGPYVKEWLDYNLLAGVNHFFIYDNDSPDNQREVLQPYIDAGIVTYFFYPGKARQFQAYNAAARDFKFFCRYMAFIDGDEFIFPHSKPTIPEVVDEVLMQNFKASALAVNILNFGSNYQDTANYNIGLMERFTRRTPVDYAPIMKGSDLHGGTAHIKTIANPRWIDYFCNSHFAKYFSQRFAVNEIGNKVEFFSAYPPSVDKISINHYYVKSREEYVNKVNRGTADAKYNVYKVKNFSHDRIDNEVFDDSIISYRDERLKLSVPEGGDILETFAARNQINFDRILKAVTSNLLPAFEEEDTKNFLKNPGNRFSYFKVLVKFFDDAPAEFFKDKLETFLTCLAVSTYLKETFIDEELGVLLEEFSLNAVFNTLLVGISAAELQLLIRELPRILALPYPVVEKIRVSCFKVLPKFMDSLRIYDAEAWKEFVNLDYLLNMLKVFDNYKHN